MDICNFQPFVRMEALPRLPGMVSWRKPGALELHGLVSQSARILAAISLLGASMPGHKYALACTPSPPVTVVTEKNNEQAVLDPQQMDEELQRVFEQWKTVPYALTFPMRVVGLRGSVPPVWIKDFMLLQGKRMRFAAEFQGCLDSIYKQLATAKGSGELSSRSVMAADVVTIGDSWLGAAISSGLVSPVGKPEELEWFQQLDPKCQAMLLRNSKGRPDVKGDVWGAPYRCGCMVIAYRKDKVEKAGLNGIKDWEDLWRPELTGKVSMIDSTREVVGLVLKSLGASYNAKDVDNEVEGGREAVRRKLLNLRRQVKVFDNVNYLKALGAGDVWVAVGWSVDVLPFARRSSNVAVVAPASGTSLWADVWAIPATTSFLTDKVGGRIRGPSPLVSQWLDFCLQPARRSGFQMEGASPLEFSSEESHASSQTGPRLDTNLISGLPPKEIRDKSEYLEPLDEGAQEWYKTLM